MSGMLALLVIAGFVIFQVYRMARLAQANREAAAHRERMFLATLQAQRAAQPAQPTNR